MRTTFTRNIFLFTLLLAAAAAQAQVARITVANGAWNNPAIWSPAGVPGPGDDITIVHQLTFNQTIGHGGDLFHIGSGASLINTGNDDTVAFGGAVLIIEGAFSCGELAVGMEDSAVNSGVMYVAYSFAHGGTFINRPTGQICVMQQLATSDDFINHGSVSANNWTNGGTTTGTGGRFCIANWFINADVITGTIDICDATPNTIYDQQMGTIAGTVTYCAAGPCGTCQLTGIAETTPVDALDVAPNPFTTSTTITIDAARIAPGMNAELVLYDLLGNEALRLPVSGNTLVLERNGLAAGVYIYQLNSDGKPMARGRVVAD